MSFQHPYISISEKRIIKPWNINLEPRSTEYNIAFQDFIFECGSETPLRSSFLYNFFDLTSDTRNCSQLSALELSYFKLTIEHALDKSSVFMHFKRLTNEFQLFHHFKLRVHFHYYTSHTDSKMRHIFTCFILQSLYANK